MCHMTIIFNRTSERVKRKALRKAMPKAEVILWAHLKNKQLHGYKFRRQYSVGPYIVDFYCPRLKLAIEVDGPSHFTNHAVEYDWQRQKYIESFNINVLRVTNLDIYENIEGVIKKIIEYFPKNELTGAE